MKKKNWYNIVRSRNLINRTFNVLEYLDFFRIYKITKEDFRVYMKNNINNICFVEMLIKYLDDKLKRNQKNVELRCSLYDLINDLDYLKLYLPN